MKQLIFLLLLSIFTHLSASSLLLQSVTDDSTTAKLKAPQIDIGVTGLVVKNLSPAHRVIVSTAQVTEYNQSSSEATVTLGEFTALKQDSLPKISYLPSAGDELVLAVNYDRAILIAPSYAIYSEITTNIEQTTWLHPDLFASQLSYEGHPTPLKSDFKNFCDRYVVGLVYLYLKDTLYTIDCRSMVVLHSTKVEMEYTDTDLPFFHRTGEIEADWFGEGSSRIDNYDTYYIDMIREASQ